MYANYGAKMPNDTAFIKQFVTGHPNNLWKVSPYSGTSQNIPVITTTSEVYKNLHIPGNLYVDGNIINPSDINLKTNITELTDEQTNKLLKLRASQFTLKKDPTNKTHYGFIAQDFENIYPELISIKPDSNMSNLKSINYLEIIPLLVNKIQMIQKELDDLKMELRNKETFNKV